MDTNRRIAAATGEPGRRADRKAARWIGVLFSIGTVVLILSGVVTGEVLTGPAYLVQVATQPNQVAIGALLVMVAGLALAMVPVVFWQIGRRYDETLAMGNVLHVPRLPSQAARGSARSRRPGCGPRVGAFPSAVTRGR